MLKKNVLVKGINNLSDARYCAGMGVQYVCFEVEPNHKNYLSTEKIVEIKNWLSGVKIGLRLAGLQFIDEEILSQVKPHFLILNESQNEQIKTASEKIIEIENIKTPLVDLQKVILKNGQQKLNEIPESVFVQKDWTLTDIEEILENDYKFGIVLSGGKEERPGFSDYGDLMDILELLED